MLLLFPSRPTWSRRSKNRSNKFTAGVCLSQVEAGGSQQWRAEQSRSGQSEQRTGRGRSSSGDQKLSAWPSNPRFPFGARTGNRIAVTTNQDKGDNHQLSWKNTSETIRSGVEAQPGDLWLDQIERQARASTGVVVSPPAAPEGAEG